MSRVLGIIAEYNPFHNGHLYHIAKSKKETGKVGFYCQNHEAEVRTYPDRSGDFTCDHASSRSR